MPDRPTRTPFLARWEGVILLLVLILVVGKQIQGDFPLSDAKVYLRATGHLLQREPLFETGMFYRFKYPPPAALFFLPLWPFPLWAAKPLFALLVGVALLGVLRRIGAWTGRQENTGTIGLLLLVFAGMLQYEIHLGQVTLIILLFLLLTIDHLAGQRPWRAAFWYAVSLQLKPFGWPLAIWALIRGQGRFLLATGVIWMALAALTLPFYGWEGSLHQWRGFLTEMQELGQGTEALLAPRNSTLAGFLLRHAGAGAWASPASLPWSARAIGFLLLALPLWQAWRNPSSGASEWYRQGACLLAAVPLIGPSEYKYFLLALPALALALRQWPCRGMATRTGFVVGAACLGGNIHDLWGKQLSAWLSDHSIVTVGGFLVYLLVLTAPVETPADPDGIPLSGEAIAGPDATAPAPVPLSLALTLAILLSVSLVLEFRILHARLVCRACDEDLETGRTVCKSCGSRDLTGYEARQQEKDLCGVARLAWKMGIFLPAGQRMERESFRTWVNREFPELPDIDRRRLASEAGQ